MIFRECSRLGISMELTLMHLLFVTKKKKRNENKRQFLHFHSIFLGFSIFVYIHFPFDIIVLISIRTCRLFNIYLPISFQSIFQSFECHHFSSLSLSFSLFDFTYTIFTLFFSSCERVYIISNHFDRIN